MLEDPYDFRPQPQSRFWGWTLFGWLVVIVLLVAVVASLTGCGTVQGICAVQPAGEDENGIQYFRYRCEPR